MSKKKSNAGAPTLYQKEYCDLLIEHMGSGLSFGSFAGVVGVCIDTIYEWAKVHPEFSEAKRHGLARLILWDEKLLNDGAQGKRRGYNINAHKWKMANIHKWSDRVETIDKSPDKMSKEELIAEAKKLLSEVDE